MRKITTSLFMFFIATSFLYPQDVIYKNDKSEIKAKVLEILDKEIKYKKFDFLDGPTYSLNKNQIFIIIYSNGQKEMFNTSISAVSHNTTKSKKEVVKDSENTKENNNDQEIKAKNEQEAKDKIVQEENEKKRKEQLELKAKNEKEQIENSKKVLLELREKVKFMEQELAATTVEGKKESPKIVDTAVVENKGKADIVSTSKLTTEIKSTTEKKSASSAAEVKKESPKIVETSSEEYKSKRDNDSASKLTTEIKSRVVRKSDEVDVNYDRSSLYTLMITNSARDYESDIKAYFENKLTPDKYNNHNLDQRFITSAFKKKDQLDNIVDYLNENKIAQNLIAKWFNRSEKGGFNLDLIKERGYYDASSSKINQAKYAKRGLSQLINPEVVKKLLDNTFILVIDSKYTNKEKVASVGKSVLSLLGNLPGASYADQLTSLGGSLVLDTFGKGYWVSTNAHLFKLVWNDEIDARFFNELWCDDGTVTPEKRKAFDNADFFALDYIGTDQTGADVQSTAFTKKTNGELVGRATVKSIENVITKLQENYDVFKTKTPIYTAEPLTAKIGLKEGVTKKTKFEVLEQQLTDNGTLEFVQVGSVKVDSNFQIWDNRFGAEEENPNQSIDKTYFKTTSGKEFAPGMLLRQIK